MNALSLVVIGLKYLYKSIVHQYIDLIEERRKIFGYERPNFEEKLFYIKRCTYINIIFNRINLDLRTIFLIFKNKHQKPSLNNNPVILRNTYLKIFVNIMIMLITKM
jgi:hypothetical protein